ncbi:hypothetical protein AMTR_s00067p00063400 [Amborella trichopoda]|uniref:Uncharacterized protein n=1 Tax=Amborella trichopoda TaxID=13333 RepID=U5D8G9_AMBTC|nr:hypothetical protein AMTR_s00067p00063400 [Amborella trichopoda]
MWSGEERGMWPRGETEVAMRGERDVAKRRKRRGHGGREKWPRRAHALSFFGHVTESIQT